MFASLIRLKINDIQANLFFQGFFLFPRVDVVFVQGGDEAFEFCVFDVQVN